MITDHKFNHGCLSSCTRDHSENSCDHMAPDAYGYYRRCGKKEDAHQVSAEEA